MKTKILSSLLAIVFTSISLFSQVTQEWVRIYSGSGNWVDVGEDIYVSKEGIYITGYSLEIGSMYDICTIKYDFNGDQKWIRYYNGPYNFNDYGHQIEQDYSGNIYVMGKIYVDSAAEAMCILKYDKFGNLIKMTRVDSCLPRSMVAYRSMAVDTAGNVYVAGSSFDALQEDNVVTVKFDSSGNRLWTKIYNGQFNYPDVPFSIALDKNGNVYVGGYTQLTYHWTYTDYLLLKYTSAGVLEWTKTYNGPGNIRDYISVVKTDRLGNIYVTGSSQNSNNHEDYCTIKYSPAGTQVWVRRYNGPVDYTDIPWDMVLDSSSNVYITGYQYTNDTNSYDCCTIKYDSAGVLKWVSVYNDPYDGVDYGRSMVLGKNNEVYVAGVSWAGTPNNNDYLLLKYSSNGGLVWTKRYGAAGNHDDICWSVDLDSSENVYVTGEADYDITTIKYSQSIGIQPISNEVPKQFALYQNYPNPFNPKSKIKFEIAKFTDVKLIVYDILGREVATLVDEQLKPGTYEVEWDGNNCPSGVYFYSLTTEYFSQTKRMVLIK